MKPRTIEQILFGLGLAYLITLSWAMISLSYDIWGTFIVLPVLILVGFVGVHRIFAGEYAHLVHAMYFGLAARFVGAGAKYFVSFGAYGGATDAQRYHTVGAQAAREVWAGERPAFSVLPSGTSTEFVQQFTGFVYTLAGPSKLAGYFIFSWLAFWGIALFVKGACIAIPGLMARRYAALCALAPSVVYWPSSIGKEALMTLALGVGSYGIARILSVAGIVRPLISIGAGLGLAAVVRPHIAGVWLAGFLPALLVAAIHGRSRRRRRVRLTDRIILLPILAIAGIALAGTASATVRYLNPSDDAISSTNVTQILVETTRRTSEADSNFVPPSISGAVDWPWASLRTLLRPLATEALGAGQLATAAELTAFVVLCLVCWRRLSNLPRMVFTNPYVAFAAVTLFLGGLAYASFANLGVLSRQKTLLFPFMSLIPCLPERVFKKRGLEEQKLFTTPSGSTRLNGGESVPAQAHTTPGPVQKFGVGDKVRMIEGGVDPIERVRYSRH